MEKKIYSRPTISETKLDSEINLVLMSGVAPCGPVPEDCFMNPLKWFR